MTTVLILHGTKGSPEGNWFPWLKQELEGRGHRVFVPLLPTPEGQSVDNWFSAVREQVPALDGDTAVIGHSCGATFALHLLEELQCPIRQTVLASPLIDHIGNEEYDRLNADFYERRFPWDRITKNGGKFTVFHGDNDPYVPLVQAQIIARWLNCRVTEVNGGGHLNAESGFTTFPALLDVLAGLSEPA